MVRVRRFRCCGLGPSPGRETEILQAMWRGQKKKKILCVCIYTFLSLWVCMSKMFIEVNFVVENTKQQHT